MTSTWVAAESSRRISQVSVMMLKVLGGLRGLLVTIGLDLIFLRMVFFFPSEVHNGTARSLTTMMLYGELF